MNTKIFPTKQDEIPVSELPDIPHWSENYCFEGYDEQSNIGFWLHLGRWPRNPQLWREQLWVYLPDGSYTSMRGFGSHPVTDGAGGALMKLRCEEPGRWRLQFEGPTRVSNEMRLKDAPASYLSDGPFAALRFNIEFLENQPAWHFGDVLKDENWCHFHYEQHGTLKGDIHFQSPGEDWQRFTMDGTGYRDHSRGPRELSTFGGNYWIHGQFANGRAFSLMHVWKVENGRQVPAFSKAVVYQDGKIFNAEFDGIPYVTDRHNPSKSYTLTLKSELDTMVIQGRIKRSVAQSADTFMDSFDGTADSDTGVLFCYEEPTEFIWNGIKGSGHTERAERT